MFKWGCNYRDNISAYFGTFLRLTSAAEGPCLAVVPVPRSADPDLVCLCLSHLLLVLLQ